MLLSPHDVRRLAVASVTDERTVRRYLTSKTSVRSTSRARIEAAIKALGFRDPRLPAVRASKGAAS